MADIEPPAGEALDEAMRRLHAAIGEAIVEWSQIERQLATWFQIISGMPEDMANGVFYAHNAFDSKLRVITEVFKYSKAPEHELEFAHAVFEKANRYADLRNRLAHWVAITDHSSGRPVAQLIQPRGNSIKNLESGLTPESLAQASRNFGKLNELMVSAHFERMFKHQPMSHRRTLPELLLQVQQLPNEASSGQPSSKQSIRARQLQAVERKKAPTPKK